MKNIIIIFLLLPLMSYSQIRFSFENIPSQDSAEFVNKTSKRIIRAWKSQNAILSKDTIADVMRSLDTLVVPLYYLERIDSASNVVCLRQDPKKPFWKILLFTDDVFICCFECTSLERKRGGIYLSTSMNEIGCVTYFRDFKLDINFDVNFPVLGMNTFSITSEFKYPKLEDMSWFLDDDGKYKVYYHYEKVMSPFDGDEFLKSAVDNPSMDEYYPFKDAEFTTCPPKRH